MSKIPSVETMGTCPKCGILLPSKLPLKKLYTMAFVLNMGHLPVRSLELICRNLVLRFHLRLAYAVSKLLLRKFLVAALNQTRNQLGAALKTGTFRVVVHRLRPSIGLAGFSGVYLCFGRLGQPTHLEIIRHCRFGLR